MNALSNDITELKREISEFAVPLQTARQVRSERFDAVIARIGSIARRLQGSDSLPRDLLNEIYFFAQLLRNEARQSDALSPLADRVEFLFGLLLKGELPEDRVPGRPRII
ncbi:MAG: hypothetical protein IPH07_06615 [Deltaproteobacteria bacterium]|nr:hypothetical protein [Deltaproteobacteria bacterium]MBK8717974.1 hypothetical protein [Deltaproteobacteria bacterium]MBP7290141.1 hypothetical protein [Nannocystaceae bacterium]